MTRVEELTREKDRLLEACRMHSAQARNNTPFGVLYVETFPFVVFIFSVVFHKFDFEGKLIGSIFFTLVVSFFRYTRGMDRELRRDNEHAAYKRRITSIEREIETLTGSGKKA